MIKLKEVIKQLTDKTYENVESKLKKTKADNFLFVLRSYRGGNFSEEEIITKLNLSHNSFYALKCRLYDRVQNELISDINTDQGHVYSQLEQINTICYNSPHELTLAFLHKLEKDLLSYGMHGELLIVYSALKKIHYNTDKYFHYSQLHNKHTAFLLSLEKTNDILSDFNSLLEQYDFSKSSELINKLLFLKKEIDNHFALNPSRQIEIIKDIISIQLFLFCNIPTSEGIDIGDLLKKTLQITNELPDSSIQKIWVTPLNYLAFEYYARNEQVHKASEFYEKTNGSIHNLLLFSNISLVAKFLPSKIEYLVSKKAEQSLKTEDPDELLLGSSMYTKVQFGIYKAMTLYYSKELKKAISKLNALLNDFSFKDYFHLNMQLKLILAFFYLKTGETEIAESLIGGVYKKIKTDKLNQYPHVLDLIKFFNTFFTKDSAGSKEKRSEALTLFLARNTGDHKIFTFLQFELIHII